MIVFRVLFFSFFLVSLFAKPIETFYGIVEVNEPVLLELIESNAFQRLKSIHQYGVAYYTTHREEYTRFDHSIGVFHLLRANGCSLNEQIAGLLHDASHTVFSHVGDWVFQKQHSNTDYQNSIHEEFLATTDIGPILKKYNLLPRDVLPLERLFPALERSRPDLCADRLEYNLQGAYHRGFITKEEALTIFNDCRYIDNQWVATRRDLMEKLVRFGLFMTEDCFGGIANHLASSWLAEAIKKSLELGLISSHEFHLGSDDVIWNKLASSEDPFIKSRFKMIFNTKNLYQIVDPKEANLHIKTKFWGFDPWITHKGQRVRLTTLSPSLEKEYQTVKDRIAKGFSIKLLTQGITSGDGLSHPGQ